MLCNDARIIQVPIGETFFLPPIAHYPLPFSSSVQTPFPNAAAQENKLFKRFRKMTPTCRIMNRYHAITTRATPDDVINPMISSPSTASYA
jgi:hypothetical protein